MHLQTGRFYDSCVCLQFSSQFSRKAAVIPNISLLRGHSFTRAEIHQQHSSLDVLPAPSLASLGWEADNCLISSSGHWDVGPGSSMRDHLQRSLAFLTQVAPPKAILKKQWRGHQRYKMWLDTHPLLSFPVLSCCCALSPQSVAPGSSPPLIASSLPVGFVCSSKHTMRPSRAATNPQRNFTS